MVRGKRQLWVKVAHLKQRVDQRLSFICDRYRSKVNLEEDKAASGFLLIGSNQASSMG
jgi:hypothetical protein